MAKLYEGSAPCPGCGRTGEEALRVSKDSLCYDCAMALSIGRAIVKERNLDRNHYNMDDLRIGQMTWYTISIPSVESALGELLKTFSQFDQNRVDTKEGIAASQLAGRADAVTAHDNFILPDITFNAAKKLCETLKNVCWELRRDRDNYQKELDAKLKEERNRIYNEGVAHGRNLLFQLNNGEITAADINKEIKKY